MITIDCVKLVAAGLGSGQPDADNPWSMFAGSGSDMLILLALIPLAVLVVWYGGKQFRRDRGSASLRPKGRVIYETAGTRTSQRWRNIVERLEARPATPVAEAGRGPVRLRARIVDASGNLGGPPGRECVWRNRPGGRPESAVGAELVIVADDSGRCGVENLERARVIAPTERHTVHHESISLQIGDELELFGEFEPDRVGDDPDPARLVYGTLGSNGALEARLVRRPAAAPIEAPDQAPNHDATNQATS